MTESPIPISKREDEEDGKTPWLALTLFWRTLEFNDDVLENVLDQLKDGNTFKIKKNKFLYTQTTTKTFRVNTRRRVYDNLREYWLTNDSRRDFIKQYHKQTQK